MWVWLKSVHFHPIRSRDQCNKTSFSYFFPADSLKGTEIALKLIISDFLITYFTLPRPYVPFRHGEDYVCVCVFQLTNPFARTHFSNRPIATSHLFLLYYVICVRYLQLRKAWLLMMAWRSQ